MRWQMTSASTCSSDGPAEPSSSSSSEPSGLSDLAAAGGLLAGRALNDSGAARLVTREGFPAPPVQSCSSLRSPALGPPTPSLETFVAKPHPMLSEQALLSLRLRAAPRAVIICQDWL